jgi:hypothetical protein
VDLLAVGRGRVGEEDDGFLGGHSDLLEMLCCRFGDQGLRIFNNREGDRPTCRYAFFAILGSDKYADVLAFAFAQ